jgi:hypothetical protein
VTIPDCAAGLTQCTAILTFASALPAFDEISYADYGNADQTTVGPTNAQAAGGNFFIPLASTEQCGASSPCGDWTVGNVVSSSPYDGGPVDSGPDAGFPDSGVPPDGGVDAGVDNTNATFATFGSSESLEWADTETGLVDAVATCMFVWWRADEDVQNAVITQFNTGFNDLRFWLGRAPPTQPSFGTSNPSLTFGVGQDWSTSLSSPTRGHFGVCFWDGTIRQWRNGVVDDGTTNGTLQTDLTISGTPGPMFIPETGTSATLDEIVIFWYSTRPSSQPISDAEAAQIYCGTRRGTDPDHPSTCASVGQLQKSDLCLMPNIGTVIDFEGSSPNPVCGVMGNPTVNGSVTYTAY